MKRRAQRVRVAFQGERGAFSEEAAVRLLGARVELAPRPTFDALFRAIQEGAADLILAPIENSLAGSVQRSYDLLLESRLHIVGEVVIRISHQLIGCRGATLGGIRTIESHPVALAQCEGFFAAYPHIRRIATNDTAGSAREVAQAGDPTRAAIAGKRAARTYGGVILARNLEDHRENYTRFVLLAPSPAAGRSANKTSLAVQLAHRPGALHKALEPFARRKLNLLKIESRPIVGCPWQYHFYLDVEGSLPDRRMKAALAELEKFAARMCLLGCYRAAKLSTNARGGTQP